MKKKKPTPGKKPPAKSKSTGNGQAPNAEPKPAGPPNRATEIRYYRILQLLQRGDYANSKDFYRELGISARQISRDMPYLLHSYKYPIEYCHSKKGWRFTEPVTHFASMLISASEVISLLLAQKAMACTRNAAFNVHLENAIEKFGVVITEEIQALWKEIDSLVTFRSTAAEVLIEPDVFTKVCAALLGQEELQLMYWKLGAHAPQPKRLRPIHLLCVDSVWYLFAHEPGHPDPEPHRYLLSRMSVVVRTSEKFERPKDFDLDEYLIHSVGVYGGADPQPVHLRLGPRAALWFGERRLHDTQEIIRCENGTAELKMTVTINPELERLILGWGSQVEVLAPQSLRESVLRSAKEILERG